LIADGTISGRIAREVFEEMWVSGRAAADIVEDKGLKQVSDTGELEAIVDQVIASGAGQVEQFRSGNEKILGWFVGQVMKLSQGKANPQMVNEILRKKLGD
jgi:aspartyl-tRNA(Asn)/glutamyl-tRNA(Gln) amidotransferase subunit B